MAGERLGSAVAIRSTAPRVSGAPSFGAESSGSVKFLGVIPNKISTTGGEGIKFPALPFKSFSEGQVKALKASARPNNISEVFGEPLRMDQPRIPTIPQAEPRVSFIGSVGRAKNILFFPGLRSVEPQVKQSEPASETVDTNFESRPKPEVKNNLTPFPIEIGRTRTNISIEAKPENSTPKLNILEQQLLLSRVMRNFVRTRGLFRGQVIPMVDATASPVLLAQEAGSPKTSPEKQAQTRAEVLQRSESSVVVRVRNAGGAVVRNRRQIVSYEQDKAVIDDKTIKRRVDALIGARDRLRALGKEDSRDEIVKESGIAYLKDYKSPIVKEFDGTQPRIAREILTNDDKELTNEGIAEKVARHPALKRDRDGVVATPDQVREVITDPDKLFVVADEVELLPVTKTIKNNENVRMVDRDTAQTLVVEMAEGSEIAEQSALNEIIPERNLSPVQLFVDRWVHNISVFQPRTQILEVEDRLVS